MNIAVELEKDFHIVSFEGELDMGSVPTLNEKMDSILKSSKPDIILFNLEKLYFIDSTGVGSLLHLSSQLSTLSIPFYFVNISSDVEEVFDILGLSMAIGQDHFKYASCEEAISSLNQSK